MVDTWFISDTHFGHQNILKFEKEHRCFNTIEEMHKEMIDRWNKVVKPKDKVYHLGDFAFGKKNLEIANHLHGEKILILGNHDNYPTQVYLQYFKNVHAIISWKGFALTHIPLHPTCLNKWSLNLHGHLHSKKIEDARYRNVSCEQNNLFPIHADEIIASHKVGEKYK